ncbi:MULTISPECIES: carbon storage regulator CsrA [Curtobacterium]|uniref:carbon storage regulator CsrA n=1 Tax=Curtobacterium TaxID=2034 RepID=UPI0018E52409|nr:MULTISPECIES: carbon storage regulator CsrA [Curtobacterium]MCA5923536.1 carbon storage regulator CsrA [Curtobacterium oceanosedimentum]QQD77565.1 carbon storage regulator CsrA [Curtobacterium sp. YC1]
MLVLTRKVGERILVGDDIVITVLDSRGDGVRIGIDAPRGVKIQREEVVRAVAEANAEAAAVGDDAEAQLRAALGGRRGPAAGRTASGSSDPEPTDS